ncbi:MAG: DUF938 domain-containing protein [Myxococcota bacterium]
MSTPTDARERWPATRRNRDPILERLREALPARGEVLEIASGSGEHAVYFAQALPELGWQPTEREPRLLASIAAWRAEPEAGAPPENLRAPVVLDVHARPWQTPRARYEALYCANMIHIAPWQATLDLFAGAAEVLVPGAVLVLYGPFAQGGRHTAPSNEAFDQSLRERDARWGVRDLDAVVAVAASHGFALRGRHDMPANNLTVVFARG